jgi:2-polyprenyl-6-methoxyphenol hydroxylase-like FAD-dependent oxidoreductase
LTVDAEVIVVGGGPAGASTAHFLASAGVDVLVLERARYPRDKTCAEYLSPQASRVLEAMGALGDVEAAGAAQLAGMIVRAPNGSLIHGEFAAGHGFRGFRDRGLALTRRKLDEILIRAAQRAGARLRERCRVTAVVTDGRGRATGVELLDESGATVTLRAALVIGADGLRSVVARRLGLARTRWWPRRVAFVAHYRGLPMGAYGEMHVEDDGFVGLADVGDGLTNVAMVVPQADLAGLGGDRDGFMERWLRSKPQLAPRVAAAERVGPVRAVGPFAQHPRRAWAPGAALVGDAADFFDPFTGEGIYAGLRGGELLAPFAAEAARARTPAGAVRTLRAYETARRREFGGKWIVERLVGASVAHPALINQAARVLSRHKDMADILVGVTGDFVPPREVLRAGYLLRLFNPFAARRLHAPAGEHPAPRPVT